MAMTSPLSADFRSRTIGDYLAALSSGAPTPGGGSAVGLAGALGCALGAMVCNLTLAKQESEDLSKLVTRFAKLQDNLIALARHDEQVFGNYRAAVQLAKATDGEKAARREAIEQALVGAAETPLAAIESALEALDSLRKTAEVGTPHALGDLMTGGFLLRATVLGSLENLNANLAAMKKPENRERFETASRSATHKLASAFEALEKAIAARQG